MLHGEERGGGDGRVGGGSGRGGGSSSLRIGVAGPDAPIGLTLSHAVPLTASATDARMTFQGGCGGPSFDSLVGKHVILEVEISGGMLYTIGFEPRAAARADTAGAECAPGSA